MKISCCSTVLQQTFYLISVSLQIFHFFAHAGWSLPLASIKNLFGSISLENMKLGGYDLTAFSCNFSIHNFDRGKGRLDKFGILFFNKDFKIVESG